MIGGEVALNFSGAARLPSACLRRTGSLRSSDGNPNAGGAGAKNIHRAFEGSLKRLGTDYIDLYWMHIWDGVTPVGEIVQTLGDLVHAGRIRYYGFSDMPAWVGAKAAAITTERGVPGPIAMQLEYSLVARDVEAKHFPAAREGGMGVIPWSPLAGGFLTGKYKRGDTSDTGRLSGANPFGDSKFTDRNWRILEAAEHVARDLGCAVAQVALAWTLAQPGVASTLAGASKVSQLESNLAATDLILSDEQMKLLHEASAPTPSFSEMLTSRDTREMVHGGHSVSGWNEQR